MMEKNTKYPIGIQTFPKLIESGYSYIDKTEYIYKIVKSEGYFFLSRPRRFGKSLLLSTIHAYFEGRRELFSGLDISRHDIEWVEHPVFHFDLNIGDYMSETGLYNLLSSRLADYEAIYGRKSDIEDLAIRLRYLIESAHEITGEQVVILVDEYEKPLLSTIGNLEMQDKFRALLKPFYGVLKSCDAHIRFAMLTGVTRLGKMSVFSDLNNLNDISMDAEYAGICGITKEELLTDFDFGIRQLATKRNRSVEETVDDLVRAYDGYRFSEEEGVKVFNPFSLLCALSKLRISDYWFETGTPTYLIELLKESRIDLWDVDGCEVSVSQLKDITSFQSDAIPMLYQSGYLTIKEFDPMFGTAILTYPNDEVRRGFMDSLMKSYFGLKDRPNYYAKSLYQSIEKGDPDGFIEVIKSIFSSIPYVEIKDFNYESEFRNVLYVIFTMLGLYVEVEKHMATGRIDMVVSTGKFVYVMEFKTSGTPEEALLQIDKNDYARPYIGGRRQIIKLGVVFSPEMRNITDWKEAR